MSASLRDEQLLRLQREMADQMPSAAAIDNFSRVFAIGPEDRVLLLMDNNVDPRVPQFIWEFARGRGAQVQMLSIEHAGIPDESMNAASKEFPEHAKPIVEWATFVVSTWFSSIINPFMKAMRRDRGQRWVKITYFRNLDLLKSEAAAFPLDVISLLLRNTAARFPKDEDVTVRVTDPRGTDLRIDLPKELVTKGVLSQSRWKGEVTAERPGCYIHYLPTHGPNFYDETASDGAFDGVNGVLVPQCSVGFAEPFTEPVQVRIEGNRTVEVCGGRGEEAAVLRDMLMGSTLIELGCGFNPKWPRTQIYPAGPNSPGGLHFGMDLVEECDYIRRTMPDWPEPPVHMDLVDLDATVTLNGRPAVEDGVLSALRDPDVRALAARYGDPTDLLENWPA